MSTASLQDETAFPFALSKDGAMRADDVPPGTYTLSIQLGRATASPQVLLKPLGTLQKQVTVPPAEDESVPVNLGELTVNREQ